MKKLIYNQEDLDLILSLENEKKDEEIEELKEELKQANDDLTWWSNRFKAVERDNRRLNNVIKEVREYIYNKEINTLHFNSKDFLDTSIAGELLEILDKENK